MNSGTFAVLCLLALAVAVAPVSAHFDHDHHDHGHSDYEKCYFIKFDHYYAPYKTYSVYKDTHSGYDCSKYCADDYKCVAYTYEKGTHRCALKHDADGCMELLDAETGIKYIGKYQPVLKDNDVHASVFYSKDVPYYKPIHKKPSGVVSASSVAVSHGGVAVSESYADNHGGAYTNNYVKGNGYSFSDVKTPYFSLTTGLKKEGHYYPSYTVEYYKETKPVAVCKTIHGKEVYFYAPKKEEPKQYGYETPCHMQKDTGYYGYGDHDILHSYDNVVDPGYCCFKCRAHIDCLAWDFAKDHKKCYLVKKVVEAKAYPGHYSGTCL